MATTHSSTLLTTEKALQPVVLCVTLASCCLVARLLAWSFLRIPALLWLACAIPALLLEASNLRFWRTHARATTGMMPLALFSLITPCIGCLCSAELTGTARSVTWVGLVLLVAMLTVFVTWISRLYAVSATRSQIAPDAALIVLGGAVRRGRPCHTLALRLDEAARLWHQQHGLIIVPTGGPTPDKRTTEAQVMARYLQEQGVSAASILPETQARNTRENIQFATKLLDEHGHHGQRCVVSSDYHLWRALRDARALGVELEPVAAPTPRGSAPQQWCREVLTILVGR